MAAMNRTGLASLAAAALLVACQPAPAGAVAAQSLGCTMSVYDSGSGSYEFRPKGFIDLAGDGYTYRGLDTPSHGTVRDAGGTLHFVDGWLDGGEAVPVADRPGQYTLTSPAAGERWSCKRVDQ